LNILLCPVGSAGDVHPFVGLGVALKQRGHDVTVITGEYFRPLAERTGLAFVGLDNEEHFRRIIENPDVWKPHKAFFVLVREIILPWMRWQHEAIVKRYEPGRTLVVANALGFGARIAHEKPGVPLATIHLQPAVLWSDYQTPYVPGLPVGGRVPRRLKRMQIELIESLLVDRVLNRPVNAFRRELGLPPARRFITRWWHSPQRVIGMFPDWFAPPQPDWPEQTVLTGFPLWDERELTEMPPEAAAFLEAGDPPIVFTPGSAMVQGAAFFAEAVRACEILGRRGMLLTRFPEQIPGDLPDSVRHFDYVPFSDVLPRAAALVSHGGIGTTAQALAAGIPHLVMPMAHDQFDNANRLKRLGVGDWVFRFRFRGPTVAKRLDRLLTSPDVAGRCQEIAAKFEGTNALADTCDVLEAMA